MQITNYYNLDKVTADTGIVKERKNSMIKITKIFKFDSSHRLINKDLTERQNEFIFGKCYNPPSHGHCFKLEVTLLGVVTKDSGMVTNFVELKAIVNKLIIDKLDHHFINEVEGFKDIIPTCENMLVKIWNILKVELPALYKLKLYETETSYAEYEGKE